MSEPDVPPGQRGAKTAKISLPDDNLGITPTGPRQMDFGYFFEINDFNGLDKFAMPRLAPEAGDLSDRRTRVAL
jgi:hypothetical protein